MKFLLWCSLLLIFTFPLQAEDGYRLHCLPRSGEVPVNFRELDLRLLYEYHHDDKDIYSATGMVIFLSGVQKSVDGLGPCKFAQDFISLRMPGAADMDLHRYDNTGAFTGTISIKAVMEFDTLRCELVHL